MLRAELNHPWIWIHTRDIEIVFERLAFEAGSD